MKMENHMYMEFAAKSVNEGVARMTVAAFMMDMNPTLDQLQDVKTAVSEAVTNAIIHGYANVKDKPVILICKRDGEMLEITIKDMGVGIADVKKAREPFFTTKPDMDRSGMGFVFMETFMDAVEVESEEGVGTTVTMTKYIPGECEQ